MQIWILWFFSSNPLCLHTLWNISIFSVDAPCGQSYKGIVGNYKLYQLALGNAVAEPHFRSNRGASVGVSYMKLSYICKCMKSLWNYVKPSEDMRPELSCVNVKCSVCLTLLNQIPPYIKYHITYHIHFQKYMQWPDSLCVFLIYQGHCSPQLPTDLQRPGPRGQDWRFRDGSRHLQVRFQHSSLTDVRQQDMLSWIECVHTLGGIARDIFIPSPLNQEFLITAYKNTCINSSFEHYLIC